ncbi:MAG: hypothetical protein ABI367_06085 [Mucilaginibacter sp.]
MKPAYFIFFALLLAGCNFQNIKISGTARGMDTGVVSIIDLFGKTIFGANITAGKFDIKQENLPASGYYTFSVTSGAFPRDYEVYLEPGSYIINIPENDHDYLHITTNSKTQNNLSAYYTFEDSMMTDYRKDKDMWVAKLNDPKAKLLPDAEINKIIEKVESTRKRERGMHIAVMDMFIKKYPQNDIVPHIITNMDYKTSPGAYYMLYNKLSTKAKNSDEGKQVGEQLQQLVKQTETKP